MLSFYLHKNLNVKILILLQTKICALGRVFFSPVFSEI